MPGIESWDQATLQAFIRQELDRRGLSQLPQMLGQFLQIAMTGTHKLAAGTGTLSWTGNAYSTVNTVTHGLGAVPLVVVGSIETANTTGTTLLVFMPVTASYTSSTFQCQGVSSVAGTFSNAFDWLAVS